MTTYFSTYDVAITPAADRLDQLNTIYNPLEFKARGHVTWRRGGFVGALFVNHLGPYDNNLVNPLQEVDSKTMFDLNLPYTFSGSGFTDGLSIGLGCSESARRGPAVREHRAEPERRRRIRPDAQQSRWPRRWTHTSQEVVSAWRGRP